MEGMLAEVRIFAGNFAPRSWMLCQGQLLSINSNQALFSLLGTIYGGDGRTTFGLPDLRGRVTVGPGTGPGLSTYREGQKWGIESVTLNQTQIPSHTHAVGTARGSWKSGASSSEQDETNPNGKFPGLSGTDLYADSANTTMAANAYGPVTLNPANQGGSQPHNNIQPYLTMNYIICVQGVFPSRS